MLFKYRSKLNKIIHRSYEEKRQKRKNNSPFIHLKYALHNQWHLRINSIQLMLHSVIIVTKDLNQFYTIYRMTSEGVIGSNATTIFHGE